MSHLFRLIVVAVLVVSSLTPAPAQSQRKGWLTFTCWGKKDFRVGLARIDGSGLKIFETSKCFDPALSPDARQIAYVRLVDDNATVVETRSVDGGAPTKVTDVKGIAFGPSWSPDGKRLAFYALDDPQRKRGPWLYIVGTDGGSLRHVGKESECFPAWSPDGRKLLFALFDEPAHRSGVGVVDVESGREELILKSDQPVIGVAWSPDGKTIAFARADDKRGSQIYTIPAGGGETKQITDKVVPRLGIDYSDDGRWMYETCIDFDADKGGIYVLKPGAAGCVEAPVLEGTKEQMYVGSGGSMLLLWRLPTMNGPSSKPPETRTAPKPAETRSAPKP